MTRLNGEYHYTECGLDFVYLANGYRFVDSQKGRQVVIEGIDELHKVIGKFLVNNRKVLSGKDFRFLRHEMSMSQDVLANLLEVSEQSIRNWEREKTNNIPPSAAALIRLLYRECIGGNNQIKAILEKIANLEEEIDRKVVLETTDDGWQLQDAA